MAAFTPHLIDVGTGQRFPRPAAGDPSTGRVRGGGGLLDRDQTPIGVVSGQFEAAFADKIRSQSQTDTSFPEAEKYGSIPDPVTQQ